MNAPFSKLLPRMQELRDLAGLSGLATWDQETYLPPKAESARAAQMATLQGMYHERLTDPVVGDLLEASAAHASLGPDERAMVRVLEWERDRAVKVPKSLVQALAEAQAHGVGAWKTARKSEDFAQFAPALERLLKLRREMADAIGHGGERYDALLEAYEPGMRVARLTPVLDALKARLVPMVRQLGESPRARRGDPLEGRTFPTDRQWTFTLRLLRAMGFDLEAGRQDQSIHPFTGGTHPQDVRLTTKLDPRNLFVAVFGTIHEGGHGLYEQGFSPEHYRTPLAATPSMGLHESQSRLWENIIGRSRAFWRHFYPVLRADLGAALEGVDLEEFHRSVNRVAPSLIRTEADEVTYNLHIVLRYELELLLLRGELPVAELPRAWNDRVQRFLGLTPPTPSSGVLQDIHWAWGEFGYFPTYSLGNLYSASLYRSAQRELPELEAQVSRGELLPLREWLRTRVHQHGFRYPAEELVQKVTGRGLTDEDFIGYLREKYSALYEVPL